MPKPMTRYKIETVKEPEHSFKEIRGKRLAYHNYGSLKTYANITQCEKKVAELRLLGHNCYRTFTRPFLILLDRETFGK